MMSDTQPPPNIVFIMADQFAACQVGCYGSGVDSTPTLDGLAASGCRFGRCYATFPVCAPNRATFLTGRSPVVHGMVSNNYVLSTDTPTYAHVLRQHGYRTAGFGKFHQTPMHLPTPSDVAFLGFDESWVTEDPKWPWYDYIRREHPGFAEQALARCWNWPHYPPRPEMSRIPEIRERLGHAARSDPDWGMIFNSDLPAELHDTSVIADHAIGFIKRHQRQFSGQPFFCHVSFVDPHDPYDPPLPYHEMFDPADMPPAIPKTWDEGEFPTLAKAQTFAGFERIWNRPEVIRRLRAHFHGTVRLIDDNIKRILDTLDQLGVRDNTVIVFTTDHGEMLGDHGLLTKGPKHYDAGIRCPLIVAGPGVEPSVSDRLTCTLDFFPTFCDWGRIPDSDRPPLEGRSFATPDDGWDVVSVAADSVSSVISQDGWRLTRFLDDDAGQLFDLNSDPQEQQNRYRDPAFAERKMWMLERLAEVTERPARVPQYRNLAVLEDKKMLVERDVVKRWIQKCPTMPSPYLDPS